MNAQDRIGSVWKQTGRHTHCAIVDDRIYAVLYWSDGFAGQHPGQEALHSVPASWLLVFCDDPEPQNRLVGDRILPIEPGMGDDEVLEVTHSAIGPARKIIRQRLGIDAR